jgi:hypothetical protein
MYRCDDCDFEYDLDRALDAATAIVTDAAQIGTVLTNAATDPRRRRAPDTWSPLEYGCHVRDVLLVQRERVLEARRTDSPAPEPMGRDERAEHDGYAEQDPERVARQLVEAAFLFDNVLARLAPADWDRTIVYNYPKRSARTLRWVAVHTEHELRHHLLDVQRQLP